MTAYVQNSVTQSVGPATLPVSIAEAKAHCRIDGEADDYVIQMNIKAATDAAETRLGRSLITQTWVMTFDVFPAGNFYLPKHPVASISSVKYYDADDTQQTVATSVYGLDTGRNPNVVYLKSDQSWPTSRGDYRDCEVIFIAGAAAAPNPVRQAILMMVSEMYENRETSITGTIYVPTHAATMLLDNYRNVPL